MLTSAQDLLTIAAELLLGGSVALYGYLFVQGLLNRSHKPVQPAAKPIPPVASSCPLHKPTPVAIVVDAVTEVDAPSCLLPCPAPATPDEATAAVVPAKGGAIVLADKSGALVPVSQPSPITAPQAAIPVTTLQLLPAAPSISLAPRLFQIIPIPPVTAIVLKWSYNTLQTVMESATATPAPAPVMALVALDKTTAPQPTKTAATRATVSLKTYRLRGEDVHLVADLPYPLPVGTKTYKLRGKNVVRVADLLSSV